MPLSRHSGRRQGPAKLGGQLPFPTQRYRVTTAPIPVIHVTRTAKSNKSRTCQLFVFASSYRSELMMLLSAVPRNRSTELSLARCPM
jgi:hypothetical protein